MLRTKYASEISGYRKQPAHRHIRCSQPLWRICSILNFTLIHIGKLFTININSFLILKIDIISYCINVFEYKQENLTREFNDLLQKSHPNNNSKRIVHQEHQFFYSLPIFRSSFSIVQSGAVYTWASCTMPPPDYSSSTMGDRRMRPRQWGKIYESNLRPHSWLLIGVGAGDGFLLWPPPPLREIKLSNR